jgi:hypothetical protein
MGHTKQTVCGADFEPSFFLFMPAGRSPSRTGGCLLKRPKTECGVEELRSDGDTVSVPRKSIFYSPVQQYRRAVVCCRWVP